MAQTSLTDWLNSDFFTDLLASYEKKYPERFARVLYDTELDLLTEYLDLAQLTVEDLKALLPGKKEQLIDFSAKKMHELDEKYDDLSEEEWDEVVHCCDDDCHHDDELFISTMVVNLIEWILIGEKRFLPFCEATEVNYPEDYVKDLTAFYQQLNF